MMRPLLAVACCCILLTGAFAPLTLAPTDLGAASPKEDGAVPSPVPNATNSSIHPALLDASGSQRVVARLDGDAAASGPASVARLRRATNRTQQPLLSVAAASDEVRVLQRFWLVNAVLLEVNGSAAALEKLVSVRHVDRIHPDHAVRPHGNATAARGTTTAPSSSPADASPSAASEHTPTTEGLETIRAPDVWSNLGVRGDGATVAVLDTGVDPTHPDLDLATENPDDITYPGGWAEFDENGRRVPDSEPHDPVGHGTHVAGTAVGGTAGGRAIGVAPDAKLLAAKVLDDDRSGTFAQLIAGLEWAVQRDADVIVVSLGFDGTPGELVEPVRNAASAGTVVVGSAGRQGARSSAAPGNVYESIGVGAIDGDGEVLPSSGGETVDVDDSWGNAAPEDWPDSYVVPDVVAPGSDVYSAVPGDAYAEHSGTSMATPHVAGTAALVVSAGEDPSPSVVTRAIEATARPPEAATDAPEERYGAGIVDAHAAVRYVTDAGVRGTVTSDSEPVAGATVEATNGSRVETAADGTFELPLPPGEHSLAVTGHGIERTTVDVTVPEESFATRGVEVAPAADVAVVDRQPAAVGAGGPVSVTLSLANVEASAHELAGDYRAANATLLVDGEEHSPGERLSLSDGDGERTVTVRTEPDATGRVELTHTLYGPGGPVAVTTGPTHVVDEVVTVGVLDVGTARGDAVAETLDDELPPRYRVEVFDARTTTTPTEGVDVLVVQTFGGAERAPEVVDAAADRDVGIVVLEQWGNASTGVSELAETTGWPSGVRERDGGSPPVEYSVDREHPVVSGVASVGATVPIHTGEYADHAWIEEVGDATVVATIRDQSTAGGPALVVDEERDIVLAAGLGRSQYAPGHAHTPASNRILANAVAHVAGAELPTGPVEAPAESGDTDTNDGPFGGPARDGSQSGAPEPDDRADSTSQDPTPLDPVTTLLGLAVAVLLLARRSLPAD